MSPHTLLWLIFAVALVGMLYVDLFQSRSDKAITLREAGLRSLEWVGAALLYCGAIYWLLSPAKAAEFLTGYLIEKSLSVDNLFVFIMIFSYFNVEPAHQPRVLKWGILGAIVLRFVLILLGSYLVSRFEWVFVLFGIVLLYSAYKMAFAVEKEFNPNENILFRGLRKILPMTGMLGNRFLAKIDGRWHATPSNWTKPKAAVIGSLHRSMQPGVTPRRKSAICVAPLNSMQMMRMPWLPWVYAWQFKIARSRPAP